MKARSTVACLFAFQILLACNGSDAPFIEDDAEWFAAEDDIDGRKKEPVSTTPTTPPVTVNPAPPVEPPPPPRTDVDDLEADAICAIRAKATPAGTFTADAVAPLAGARDVSASLATLNTLQLKFDFPAELGERDGRPYRTDASTTLEVIVPSAAKDALVVGAPITVSVSNFAATTLPCSTVRIEREAPQESKLVSLTSKLTLTARSETRIEGALDIVEDGKTTHLTFRAPITDKLAPRAEICCLKPR